MLRKTLPRPFYLPDQIFGESDGLGNVCLIRILVTPTGVISILSTLFIGTPFLSHISEETKKNAVNRAVTKAGYDRYCIPVIVKGDNPLTATSVFVGLNIAKFRKELVLPSSNRRLTFLDVVIIFLLSCIEESNEVDELLKALFPVTDSVGRLFEKCVTVKDKAECIALSPEVLSVLLRLSPPTRALKSSIDVYMQYPLLIFIDAKNPLVECTHTGLKTDIVAALCELDRADTRKHLAYYLKKGCIVINACDRMMLTIYTPRTAGRVAKIRAFGSALDEGDWRKLVDDIPHFKPLVTPDSVNVAKHTLMHVVIFEILHGKDELTFAESVLYPLLDFIEPDKAELRMYETMERDEKTNGPIGKKKPCNKTPWTTTTST